MSDQQDAKAAAARAAWSRVIEHTVKQAPQSPDDAAEVLEFFCDAVETPDGEPPDRRILEYVAGCFRRILAGEAPEQALSLTGGKGRTSRRKAHALADRDLGLARAVVRRMNHGAKKGPAIAAVAQQKGAPSESVVTRAYEEYSAGIRRHKLE